MIRLTKKLLFAIEAVLDIAYNGAGAPVRSSEITEREGIPVVPLYFARNGERYRSLGEKGITLPIKSEAATIPEIIAELEATKTSERAGRVMDHDSEHAFERLRLNGYM